MAMFLLQTSLLMFLCLHVSPDVVKDAHEAEDECRRASALEDARPRKLCIPDEGLSLEARCPRPELLVQL